MTYFKKKDNNLFTFQTVQKKNINKTWQHKKSQQTHTIFFLNVSLSHDETTRLNSVS